MTDIRGPDYELAEKDYMLGMKYKDIAEKYNVSINTVKSWKQRYKWNRKGVHTKKKSVHTKKEDAPSRETIEKAIDIEKSNLTEKQKLFCLYYVKTFNATQSAINAGYSPERAHVTGSELVRNSKVKEEIQRLKGTMTEELFIDAMDVLKKYISIAFADITDFVSFGKKEIQVMSPFGPLEDDEGNPIMQEVNYVDFKQSNMVDGGIIKEAKKGKDGVAIKLEDRMKALEKLEKYFDLIPDNWKRKIEEEKLNLEKRKVEGEEETQSRVLIVNDKEEMRKAMMEYDKNN